jgi:hypothetical protein
VVPLHVGRGPCSGGHHRAGPGLLPASLVVVLGLFLVLASVGTSGTAISGWETPHAGWRAALVEKLESQGIRRVESDWQLAYVLRFLSGGRILASSRTPVRFPEVNAAVSFAPAASSVAIRPEGPGGEDVDAVDSAFLIQPRAVNPPPETAGAFARLDPYRTLYAADEPFPLLAPSEFRRDWKGWPYRRPLNRFDAVIWDPRPDGLGGAAAARIEKRLQELVASGEFAVAAEWSGRTILTRPGRHP